MTATNDWSTTDIATLLVPLAASADEDAGWRQVVQILNGVFGCEITTAFEFVDSDRAAVRSWLGPATPPVGGVVPIAPDAQIAYVRDADGVVISDELFTERRFVPGVQLFEEGIRSSMSTAIEVSGTRNTVLGVHSLISARFGPTDADLFESIGHLVGEAMTRPRKRELPDADARADSHVDGLTGLMNRSAMSARLVDVCDGTDATNAVLIGLDGFTSVNDAFGHQRGDEVLQEIAARLERSIDVHDLLGRLGGDEFLLLTDHDEPGDLAQQMIGHVEETILVDTELVQLSASAGITRCRPGDTAADLLERANHLMSQAKAAGRGQVRSDIRVDDDPTGHPGSPVTLDRAVGLDQVDEAIDGLRVVVQPIIDVFTGRLHGVEALARGPHGHVLEFPDRLFPATATFGRLAHLELEAKRLAFDLPLDDDLTLYVNLEPVLLTDREWMTALTNAWESSSRRPSVTAELTERAVLSSPGRLLQAVQVCREFGWRIALDDVGRADPRALLPCAGSTPTSSSST